LPEKTNKTALITASKKTNKTAPTRRPGARPGAGGKKKTKTYKKK